MICPNCGMETSGKFCPSCGTKMPAPEPPVPPEADEAVKQAEIVASAASAAIAAETVRPDPSLDRPAPAQGSSSYPGQSPNPAYTAPRPEYPNQSAPAQPTAAPGYQPFPNRAPNPGYAAPNPGYPNQGYAPNQAYPNQPQGYNPFGGQTPSQGYVPAQGYNPGVQNTGGYRVPTQAEIGKSPASQLLRRLGSSGAFLVGVILTTVAFLFNLLIGIGNVTQLVRMLPAYSNTDFQRVLATSLASIIGALITSGLVVLLLWLIFGAAANKRSPKMGTGALTTFKVFFIIGLVGVCLLLTVWVIFGVLFLILGDNRDAAEFLQGLNGMLAQFGTQLPMAALSEKVLFAVLFCALTLVLVFTILYFAKLLKTINTAKRVVRTGRPDDRVSPFAAILIILGAVFSVFRFLSNLLGALGTAGLLSGIVALLSAAAAICFAVVIFKFRSGMRRLGVYRGVMTQPMQ